MSDAKGTGLLAGSLDAFFFGNYYHDLRMLPIALRSGVFQHIRQVNLLIARIVL